MARGSRGAAAYRNVDISCIPEEHRDEIIADADAGGKDFGLVVTEIAYSGAAQTNIYGVYSHDEEKWLEAQAEFGFEENGTDANLTQKAIDEAAAEAAKIDAKEKAEIEAIAGKKK